LHINTIEEIKRKDMKFDIIVENPPYQHPTNRRWKLWVSFLEMSLNVLKPNGKLLFVSPISWFNGFGKEVSHARKIIGENNLEILNDANKFFDVGDDIWYIVLTKEKYKGKTLINGERYIEFDPSGKNLLYEEDKIKRNIIEKIKNSDYTKVSDKAKRLLIDFKKGLKSKELSLEKTSKYKYEIYNTASLTLFSNDDKLKNKLYPKLIINMSGGYYSDKDPNKYMLVSDSIIAGRGAYEIPSDSIKQSEIDKSLFSSNLYRYYIENVKTSGYNHVPFLQLPYVKNNHKWSNQEVYNLFDLSDKEIEEVEKFIKIKNDTITRKKKNST